MSSRVTRDLTIVLIGLALGCSGPSSNFFDDPPADSSSGAEATGGTTATGGTSAATGGSEALTGGSAGTAGAPAPSAGTAGAPSGAGGGSDAAGGGSGGSAGTATPPVEALPPSLIGDVEFSTPSQSFRGELGVGMTTLVTGAEIRFTTDGTPPAATSTLYEATPVVLTSTTQLRAQAFLAGLPAGRLSTALYIARDFDFSSDLPIVIVDGYGLGKPEDQEVYLDAAVMLFEPVAGAASLAALPTVATRAGYHVRGQSSSNFPQTPYRLELWDNANEDADHALLGMPADADWALIAPYYDRALVRNPLVYSLGRDIGLEAPRTAFAEVYVNYEARALAETDYQGVYWVTETIKNSATRTDLKQLRETDVTLPDISGGYIFKFDQAAAEEPLLLCTGSDPISTGVGERPGGGQMGGGPMGGGQMGGTCWNDLELVDPDQPNAEQTAWLTSYIQSFHDSLQASPLGDYASFIDVPSFVDYLIVNELTRNVDAYVRSAFYHKDRDGLVRAGPLWDYNFSLAVGGASALETTGWQFEGMRNINDWYPQLTSDVAFMDQVRARYASLRQGPLSQPSLDDRISLLTAPLANAALRDFAKWPVSEVYPTDSGFVRGPMMPTWPEQVQALRDFIAARLAWMDEQLQ